LKPKKHILPVIILSQFACTTLWFAGNAVVDDLAVKTGFGNELVGFILSFVQFGFIIGTLTFALLMIADRFPPSRVFLVCAVLAALCNIALLSHSSSKVLLLAARFGTGFFRAGIYPVGMKIAADYYEHGLGKALGYLVGALVFGKSFPYL
jgi:MFS family permease